MLLVVPRCKIWICTWYHDKQDADPRRKSTSLCIYTRRSAVCEEGDGDREARKVDVTKGKMVTARQRGTTAVASMCG